MDSQPLFSLLQDFWVFFIKNRHAFIALCFFTLSSSLQAQTKDPLTLDKLLSQLKTPTKSITPLSQTVSTSESPAKKTETGLITNINIVGLKSVSKEEFINSLLTRANEPYNPTKTERDEKNIQSLGYFKSVQTTTVKDKKGNVSVTFKLVENPKVGNIQFVGAKLFSKEALLEKISSKENTIHNINTTRKDIKAIEEKYKNEGYSQAKVYRILTPEKDGDSLEYYIAEGIIESITITGNRKTRDYVIVREFDTLPGHVLNDKVFRDDLRRIYNLGYFLDVNPNIRPSNTTVNAYDIEVELKEKETSGSFSIGGGYSPSSGFSLMSDLYWDNIMGTGQMILLKGNFALGGKSGSNSYARNNNYQFKYYNPWMWDKRKSFTFRTWLTEGNFNSFNPIVNDLSLRNEKRQGFDVAIGIPKNYNLELTHRGKFEDIQLKGNSANSYRIFSYTFGVNYDTRDYKDNPREGDYHSFSIEQGLKPFPSGLEFTQTDITLRKFIPTFKKQTIALKAQLGYFYSPEINNVDKIRAQYYYVGGSYSVRGYNDLDPFAYGIVQSIGSIEYRHIFTQAFTGYLFVDVGTASLYESDIFRSHKYRLGKGVGIKFTVPGLGPIRLDFGIDDLGTSRIHFNIGHAF